MYVLGRVLVMMLLLMLLLLIMLLLIMMLWGRRVRVIGKSMYWAARRWWRQGVGRRTCAPQGR